MNIANKQAYYNSIYSAIVVNSDTSQDPQQLGRVQIYIPSMQYRYEDIYKNYINESNKSNSEHKAKFPWATTLISNLSDGTYVYGSFIDNTIGNYIVLGIDVNNKNNAGVGGDTNGTLNGLDLLELTIPIIALNEVGFNTEWWPDSTPSDKLDSTFGRVNPDDRGSWSIGLFQWHCTKAFDLLKLIAQRDSNWKSCFVDTELELCKTIQASIVDSSTNKYRDKYNIYKPEVNGPEYRSIKNMLLSNTGIQVQKEKARNHCKSYIDQVNQNNIPNPAMVIYIADMINQYNDGGLPETRAMAESICKENPNLDIMKQLDMLQDWCRSRYQDWYEERRQRTYSYILELYKQGKLNTANLVDLGEEVMNSSYVPEYGDYCWPLKNSTYITTTYGPQQGVMNYNFKYNTKWTHAGYHDNGGRYHYGIDFAAVKAGVEGDECLAVGNGTVSYVCGLDVGASGGQGNCIMIKMDRNPRHHFVYMHLCKKPALKVGDRVTAGQVVGYMGNTGASQGVHLHLGLHLDGSWTRSGDIRIDPLPLLGKKIRN